MLHEYRAVRLLVWLHTNMRSLLALSRAGRVLVKLYQEVVHRRFRPGGPGFAGARSEFSAGAAQQQAVPDAAPDEEPEAAPRSKKRRRDEEGEERQ